MAEFVIKSDTHNTKSVISDLYNYLIDFSNFKNILPEDRVENFTYTSNECSFTINGITSLKVKIADKIPFSKIKFQSEGLAKFNFELEVVFSGLPQVAGECYINLTGDLNPFIKTMAEKPLTQLVNTMALKLSQLQITNV